MREGGRNEEGSNGAVMSPRLAASPVELNSGPLSEILQSLGELGLPSEQRLKSNLNMDICVFRSGVFTMWEDNGHSTNGNFKLKTDADAKFAVKLKTDADAKFAVDSYT